MTDNEQTPETSPSSLSPENFTSSQDKAQEKAMLAAAESLLQAAEEDGEECGQEEDSPTETPEYTQWSNEDFAAVPAEQLADLPEDIPSAPQEKIEEIREALYDVVDPELGVNIVDLGLVYEVMCDVAGRATVNMTLTSPACPLTDVLEDQAFVSICTEGHARALRINWVWMPPWGPHMITDDGKEQLRALGFTL